MTLQKAGSALDYRVTFLEMTGRPAYSYPRLPVGADATLLKAENPPVWYLLCLYDAVGRDYAWEDLHDEPEPVLAAWLADPDVALWTFSRHGWPHGFFVLDTRAPDETDLALFGLVPQAIGRGLGSFLLQTAVLTAWERPGIGRLTVNTCSLDHPRALVNYQRYGFVVTGQEQRSRVLRRDHDLSHVPR